MTSLSSQSSRQGVGISSLPERIVLCVDLGMGGGAFGADAPPCTKFDVAVDALSGFATAAAAAQPAGSAKNEFAVCVLHPHMGARTVRVFICVQPTRLVTREVYP